MGEPLYLDVRAALDEAMDAENPPFAAAPHVVGGRYGLSSKEFTPGMAKAVFDDLAAEKPRRHFVVGVNDDVSLSSLAWDPEFTAPRPEGELQAMFFGLGADGTVGANKNSAKIISDGTGKHVPVSYTHLDVYKRQVLEPACHHAVERRARYDPHAGTVGGDGAGQPPTGDGDSHPPLDDADLAQPAVAALDLVAQGTHSPHMVPARAAHSIGNQGQFVLTPRARSGLSGVGIRATWHLTDKVLQPTEKGPRAPLSLRSGSSRPCRRRVCGPPQSGR